MQALQAGRASIHRAMCCAGPETRGPHTAIMPTGPNTSCRPSSSSTIRDSASSPSFLHSPRKESCVEKPIRPNHRTFSCNFHLDGLLRLKPYIELSGVKQEKRDVDMAYQKLPNKELMGDEEDEDLHLLLIGKTGSGKSAAGNIIFNGPVFESQKSSSSVTKTCNAHTDVVNKRSVTVIDTPDFRFSTHTDFDSDSELKRALRLCSPGAHVILLILPLRTFTEHEKSFIDWFEQKFGAEALRFTLVLFTHADQRHEISLEEMIRANPQLSDFINRCGQRYHEFNIKAPAKRRQVTELMEKVDRLVTENINSCYTLEKMQETERRREEEERAERERKEREHQMRLDKIRRETEERVREEYFLKDWAIVEKPEQDSTEEEMRETEECTSEQSNLQVTSWTTQDICMAAVGAVVGATGGAVVGGAVVSGAAFFGAVIGGVGGANCRAIADRAKGETGSGAESHQSD